MSSDFRLICLQHDPAIALDAPEYRSIGFAEYAATHRDEDETLTQHIDCPMLIGRYSSPLVELGCPGNTDHCRHRSVVWIEANWLRMALAALRQPGASDTLTATTKRLPYCWRPDRLTRLANLLEPS